MDGVQASHCPLCRLEYKQLAAPCGPFQRFLVRAFPAEMAAREAETDREEREIFMSQAPRVPLTLPKAVGASSASEG
eukprot:CAMPEP_0172607376 /NCGR_PEP_ID=MMETSP1068-20121228/27574_1 /TAXON_ID=35684 /ORGANISM="Pseudopedinella elastica, Strain CCMP716" /LENGTH=76 /DNA_ID=CAMNT_0013410359 /DNA_START=263 /DNA_END=489 /DNA_ORIENTATION=-